MARKSRVATVYMQVAPSMDGFFTKITRDVNSGMPSVGQSAGSGLGKSLASGAGKAFSVGWKALKIGTLVTAGIVGGLAAAFTTKVLKGGISRALNIEDAQATLKGLGYQAAQIKGITDDVLASVRGTAFALDDAMTIAASALAAGVPEGQGLTDYLKLIADTATITKSDLGEIGSIFNRVKASGRAFTLELNMLADRGLPVFSWLQEEFGVTAEELRKMVAAGKVDSETFAKVLEENIGGAALTSADTTRGALANVGAAMSRLGAVVAGGSLPVVKDMLVAFIPALDAFAEALKPVAEEFWATFGPKVVTGFTNFLTNILGLIDGTKKLPAPLQLAFAMFRNFGTVVKEVYGFIAPLIPLLVTLAQTVGGLLTPIFEQLSGFVKANAAEFELFGVLIVNSFKELAPAVGTVVPILSNLLSIFGNLLITALPLLAGLLDLAVAITNMVMPAVLGLTGFVKENIEVLKFMALGMLAAKGALVIFATASKIVAGITALWKGLTLAIVAYRAGLSLATAIQIGFNIALTANPIGILVVAIGALVGGIVYLATQTTFFQDVWTNLTNAVKEFFDNILRLGVIVGMLFDMATGTTIFQDTWKNMTRFVQDSVKNIKAIISEVGKWMGDVGRNVANFFMGIANSFAGLFKGVANFFIGIINNQINAVNYLIGLINSIQIPIPEFARALFGGAKNIGFNIGKIANIPALATGANVMGPTIAMVGEEKPETVTDLGLTNKFIANTNKLVEAQMNRNSTEPQIINITVEAGNVDDPYTLTRLISKELSKQKRR